MPTLTLPERKTREARRRREAAAAVMARLRDHARQGGGRFVVFGSVARGEIRHDSDIDILADFAADRLSEALDFAERVCAEADIPADIQPAGFGGERLRSRIAAHAIVLE